MRNIPNVFCSTVVLLTLITAASIATSVAMAQPDDVVPMGDWKEFKTVTYRGNPILVHLRTGYERALLLPEPVLTADDNPVLPGCEILIDRDVVGFYPRDSFKRTKVAFIGIESGTRYEILIRSSTVGLRQPIEIAR